MCHNVLRYQGCPIVLSAPYLLRTPFVPSSLPLRSSRPPMDRSGKVVNAYKVRPYGACLRGKTAPVCQDTFLFCPFGGLRQENFLGCRRTCFFPLYII